MSGYSYVGILQHQEEVSPEPDIWVELEKENVGFGLPSHSAISNHLQPFSPLSSQGVDIHMQKAFSPLLVWLSTGLLVISLRASLSAWISQRHHLRDSVCHTAEDPMALAEQPLAENPAALMGLPDLPFMRAGLQHDSGLHRPNMLNPTDRSG